MFEASYLKESIPNTTMDLQDSQSMECSIQLFCPYDTKVMDNSPNLT
jgi:hypothetical protein